MKRLFNILPFLILISCQDDNSEVKNHEYIFMVECVSYDTTYVTGFSSMEVTTSKSSSISGSDGEVSNMIVPVKSGHNRLIMILIQSKNNKTALLNTVKKSETTALLNNGGTVRNTIKTMVKQW